MTANDEERRDRGHERRSMVYGFLFGIFIFGGVFLYLRVGFPALVFVLACLGGMLFFAK